LSTVVCCQKRSPFLGRWVKRVKRGKSVGRFCEAGSMCRHYSLFPRVAVAGGSNGGGQAVKFKIRREPFRGKSSALTLRKIGDTEPEKRNVVSRQERRCCCDRKRHCGPQVYVREGALSGVRENKSDQHKSSDQPSALGVASHQN